jgi:hypothetical protein
MTSMGPLLAPSNAQVPKLKAMQPKPLPIPEVEMSGAPTANMASVASMTPNSDGLSAISSAQVSAPASASNSRAPSVAMSDAASIPSRANTNSPAKGAETKTNNPSPQLSAEIQDVEMKDAPADEKTKPRIRVVQPPKNFNPLGGNSSLKPTQNPNPNPAVRKRPLDNNPLLVRKKQKKT